METETVTISKTEYERLLESEDKLACLEAVGVDNWQGFDDAMSMFFEGKEDS
jgi:hypothetical protein